MNRFLGALVCGILLKVFAGCASTATNNDRNLSSTRACDLNSGTKLSCQIADYPRAVLIIQNQKVKHKNLIIYFHGNNDDQSTTDRYNLKYNFTKALLESKSDKLFVMPLSLSNSKMMQNLKKGETNFGATIDYQQYFVQSQKFDNFIQGLEQVNGGAFDTIDIISHSGGYRTIAGLSDYLDKSKNLQKIKSITLLDSVYGFEDKFVKLSKISNLRFISVYGANTETAKYNINIQNIFKSENRSFSICKFEDKNCLFSSLGTRASADNGTAIFVPVSFDHSEIVTNTLSTFIRAFK